MPFTQSSAKTLVHVDSIWIDSIILWAITGIITLSSKFPDWPAIETVVSFPITWAQTWVNDSAKTGFTLPGIIEEPGCIAGRIISPNPHLGPLPNHRISLPIFINEVAAVFNVPLKWTRASFDDCDSKWFLASLNFKPTFLEISFDINVPNLGWEFIPVPTAVPPWANDFRCILAEFIKTIELSTISENPLNSCPKVIGVASWRWVLPILNILSNALAFFDNSFFKIFKLGINSLITRLCAEICIAVGITSLLDWQRFTWSFGWILTFPLINLLAKVDMTSFAFILEEVPDPVWKISTMNSSSCLPSITSCDAFIILFDIFLGINFKSPLTLAAEYLIIPSASINGLLNLKSLIGKFWTALAVWAAYSAFFGTFIVPIESDSIL